MIETERLILRRWREADLAPFAAINRDPKVMATLGPLRTLEETKASITKIEKSFEDFGYGLYATELKETGEMIGYIGCLDLPPDMPITPRLEIGWRISSAHWGHGYAPEGAKAVLRDMFSHPGVDEIISITATINANSISVMKKIGMHSDAAENFDHPKVAIDNPLRPHVIYRLKKNEFISLAQ